MPAMSKFGRSVATLFLFSVSLFAFGCIAGSDGPGGGGGGRVRLNGMGATFPKPLYDKWVSEYGKLHSNIEVDYQPQGSGAGIKGIQSQTIDFGASDAPMSEADMKAAPGEILHIPTALGAVVITYNLQGVAQPLQFAPDVLADIYLGKIKRWDDPRIKADNAGATLPATDITVVYRADASGTSAVFTDYLSKVSPEWKAQVGSDKSPKWPIGQGGKGNEGLMGMVKQQPNTIGYTELTYALAGKLPVARIKNSAGKFVEPTLDTVTAAANESIAATPTDLRVTSITNPAGADAYPISTYTYILAYKEQKDATKGKALADFLWWSTHDGVKYARELQYGPLPPEMVKRVEEKLNSMTAGGKPLRQ